VSQDPEESNAPYVGPLTSHGTPRQRRGHKYPGPLPGNICTATNRQGEPCRKGAVFGLNVCMLHGGKSPNAVAVAKMLLARGAEPAMRNVLRVVDSANPAWRDPLEPERPMCVVCGYRVPPDEKLKIATSLAIIDRNGMGPTQKFEIEHIEQRYVEYLTDDELIEIEEIIEKAKRRAAAELGEDAEQSETV